MKGQRLRVKYVTVNNCFVYVPDTWQREFTSKGNVLKVTHQGRDLFFSSHSRHSPDYSIKIGATFARVLGIREGDDVFVDWAADTSSVSRVKVVPRNSQDWEIVELQSARIQESLLSQINIVAVNQEIVVWVSKFLSVVLSVESLEPSYKYGRLEPFTEVEVTLPKSDKKLEKEDEKPAEDSSLWNLLKNFVPNMMGDASEATDRESAGESVNNMLRKYSKRNLVQTFRVLPLKAVEYEDSMNPADSLFEQPYNVFVRERFLPRNLSGGNSSREYYCRMEGARRDTQFIANKVTSTNFLRSENPAGLKLAEDIVARVFVVEDVLTKCSKNVDGEYFADDSVHPSIYVSENLRQNLRLKIGGKATVEWVEYSQDAVEGVEIFPQNDSVTQKNFEDYLQRISKHNKVLVNSSSRLILPHEKSCVVRILPTQTSHAEIDFYDLKKLRIHFREAFRSPENEMESLDEPEKTSLENISTHGLRPLLSECETVLRLSLGLDRTLDFGYDRENILICGKAGCGKTTVCRVLRETFRGIPSFVHFHEIDCKGLKGKRVENIQKTFLPAILDCIYHQPSILFVDDLESIAGRTLDDEENTPDSINTARIADMLLNLITEYQAVHHVAVVATCTSPNKISQKLAAPRGIHFFRTILAIPEFEKEDRVDILRLSLQSKLQLSNDVNWNDYGNKTEGWMPQDLTNFSEKAIFTAWKRHVKSGSKASPILCDEDLSQSLKNSVPMSLQGIDLYSGPGHAWSDIGGLAEAKQSLIELLHWPLKYPELFKNAPIRHQGGVLLYGAPGTGKTMLAGAVAKECGLSFISVKGPELLSKYIGASEEAVRNVFEKANSAKPCILFFDEFDSLAPRRGQDSTGVTDRVVNQFLAQLDGVEGRQGVAVVAASSRPDLLDPALLRPGRLDKALLCPLPNENEREEILEALCRSQKLDLTLLDLKTIAMKTPRFTGADLNSIISQARLSALEEHLADLKSLGEEKMTSSTVTQSHLIAALSSSRPSLSLSEMSKYNIIYSKFARTDDDLFTSSNNEDLKNNQRATLA